MFLRSFALTTAAACAFAGSALAQSQPYGQLRPAPQGWTVDLGAGVLYRNDSNGDTGSKTTVAPWVSANYRDLVYLSPMDGLGWNAIKTDDFRAGLQLRPRFSADDIEGLTLDRPDFGADVAAYAYKRLPGNIVVGGRVSRGVTGVSEGTEYYASVGHQRVTSVGLLNASVYVRGGDAKLADAYYGVSTAEATANGISAYSPGGGLQGAGASLFLLVPIGDKWGAGALVNYERRLGDVADSPLSQEDDTIRTGVFVARRFGG
ncbi:MipA/OmpV family protein [Brevundimonas sp.]|uniref:MipA/OmpV family protein n=1 Tax=Brevundimonas sp. TaxID=1871086 RepID=UPI003566AA8E